MAVSRRQVARYCAEQLAEGVSVKKVGAILAAYVSETKASRTVDQLLSDVEYYLQTEFGYNTLHIQSAHALGSEVKKQVMAKVGLAAKSTALDDQIDEQLIGGIVVSTGGKEFDGSVKSALKKLTTIAGEGA